MEPDSSPPQFYDKEYYVYASDSIQLMEGIEDTVIELNSCNEYVANNGFDENDGPIEYEEKKVAVAKTATEKTKRKVVNKKLLNKKNSTAPKSGKKAKSREFTVDEKKTLAGLIEKEPYIWDLNNKLHSNIYAITSAWNKIANIFPDCKVSDCKAAWRSLKGSARYYKKKNSKKGNTGDSADEVFCDEIDDFTEWEFAECMTFLQPMSQKYPRKTTVIGLTGDNDDSDPTTSTSIRENNCEKPSNSSFEIEANFLNQSDVVWSESEQSDVSVVHNNESFAEGNNASLNEQIDTFGCNSGSNYDYATPPKKKDLLTESVVSITKGIEELVDIRRTEMQNNQQETHRHLTEDRLKFNYMWGNFDQLIQMLPASDVFDLNLKFLELIHDKLKKNAEA